MTSNPQSQTAPANPTGLKGIAFVEMASPEPERLAEILLDFGFSKLMKHKSKDITLFRQNDIIMLVNNEPDSFAVRFSKVHGPCISSMGWYVEDADLALAHAISAGAVNCEYLDYKDPEGFRIPAIYGIGQSLIYFIDNKDFLSQLGFEKLDAPTVVPDCGFLTIDHLTNNVGKGEMAEWTNFYKKVFGFEEVRYFDIKGQKTGLTSFALRSPCGNFCIPINEGTEEKSQINEYLREYKGPGVQHLAFLTQNLLSSLDNMQGKSINFLNIDAEYYATVFDRVPNVTEDKAKIADYNVLADGDADGYLLQIFSKNLIGPIFIELIQRKNHQSFGEGNFGALFRSIEKDQEDRGVL